MKPGLDNEILALVMIEVMASYSKEEIKAFKSFEDFYSEVSTQNAYEVDWDWRKYRPYFAKAYGLLKDFLE